MKNKSIEILALVQLPPPIHGASLMNQRIVDITNTSSSLSTHVLRLNYAYDFKSMHDPVHKKLIYTLKTYLSFLYRLVFCRPDFVYIAFSPFGLGFYRDFMLSMISKLFGCKVKLHLHGTGLSSTKSKVKTRLLRGMFSSCDLILLSESLYADVAEFIEFEKVTFISNAVETPNINERKKSDAVSFLYMANLDARKGVFKALDVFSEFSKSGARATLKIVGAGTVFLSESDLAKHISDDYPDISERVHILGALYGEDKERAFVESDIFLYPTDHDAAPLVVLEALSYALPVVCSNQGALRDMFDNGVGGFVIGSFNVNSYVDAISIILSDYEQFSNSARHTHLKKHSISTLTSKVKELFHA